MGMPAGTDEAENAEFVTYRGIIDEINKGALIVSMDAAGTFGTAERACA